MRRCIFAMLLWVSWLKAQSAPQLDDCLAALAGSAATFGLTAPGLTAQETLEQRGRRAYIERFRGRKDEIKDLDFTLPEEFRIHRVISRYALAEIGSPRVLHEIRTIMTIDSRAIRNADEARRVLTIGLESPDDATKRQLLENLDRHQLEGAVTDFGQLILLFTKRHQNDYRFSAAGAQEFEGQPVIVLKYVQIAGSHGVAFFNQTTGEREPTSGEIWLRARDLLPVRITLSAAEMVSRRYTVRTDATVDYTPSPFGLVPGRVMHKQFLNKTLMVENNFQYTGFERASTMVP